MRSTDVIFRFDRYELNTDCLELRRDGQLVDADGLVVRLLACLVQSAGRLVTKEELVDEVWDGRVVADNAITVSVARLRKTLGVSADQQDFVATVYGRGYRFVHPVASSRGAVEPVERVVPVVTGAEPPFVGRERVLHDMRQSLAAAQAGRGGVCLLFGEPGIGKTRTVEVFEREVAGTANVFWTHCPEGADLPPLWPWVAILREVTRSISPQRLQRALGPAAAEIIALCKAPRATRGVPAPGAGPLEMHGPGRFRGFDAIVRTLRFVSDQTPLMLAFDDLHHADAASLELLHYLLGEIARMRVLVIATLRYVPSDSREETLLTHILGHRNCQRLGLDRLTQGEVSAYVGALLEDPDGSLAQAIYDKSEGNPFFMVELARGLREVERPDPNALKIEGPALDLIRQRVSRLDAATHAVLSAAAVIGHNFDLSLLGAMLDRDPSELISVLDRARAAGFISLVPQALTEFAFEHDLLRSVLYEGLSAPERRSWHLRITQVLEARIEAGGTVAPSNLAYHLYSALPDGNLRKTVHYCYEAATAASEYGDRDAARYLRQALEALALIENGSPRLRVRLLFLLSLYTRGRGRPEYETSLREVLRIATELGQGQMLVHGAMMLNPHPGLEPLPGGPEALATALPLLAADDHATRALALAAIACTPPNCFNAHASRELFEQASTLARSSKSKLTLYGTLHRRLYAQGGPAHPESAQIAQEIEQIAQNRSRQMPVLPINLAFHRALVALQRGDEPASAMQAFEHAETLCRALRHLELTWYAERFRLVCELNYTPSPDKLEPLEQLHRRGEHWALAGQAVLSAFDRIVIGAELGQPATLDETLRKALAHEPSEPPSMWALKVRARASVGMLDEARALLHMHPAHALTDLPCDRDYLGTLGHLTRAALCLGELDYARVLYQLLERYPDLYTSHVSTYSDGSVAQLLGMLARALGQHAEARAHFEAGVTLNQRASLALRAAEARLQLAEALAGDPKARARALALVKEAAEAATRAHAVPLEREAARLLRELGAA